MSSEEKQLLLRDLCVRLPYGVKIHIDFNENGHIVGDATLNTITSITGTFFDFIDFEQDFKNGDCCPISGFASNNLLCLEDFKPYLRSLSSMTEEERYEYDLFFRYGEHEWDDYTIADEVPLVIDWLNVHHFDYRGLIEKGLAIEITKENNPYK
jgi:hypothetical protein